MSSQASLIAGGKAVLGVELGSTRIKAVLIGPDYVPLASGSSHWESQLVEGRWSYGLGEAWRGVQTCYATLARSVEAQYGVEITRLAGLGVSGMMHGYLAFDQEGNQLVPFRTWRNTTTARASEQLSEVLDFTIPQRWSIAHYYQAILDQEEHVPRVSFLTTLSGYIHWKLTGQKVLGIGDASGMFPVDESTQDFDPFILERFDAVATAAGIRGKVKDLMPKVLIAGVPAGRLTQKGALMLDPSGKLEPGCVTAPPEGDAGTGMVATNSIGPGTGNISLGTSVFAMVALAKPLSKHHPTLDIVATPSGKAVAMAHCNNGADEINTWVGLFVDFARAAGLSIERGRVFDVLFDEALKGEPDCGGALAYNLLAGEPVLGLNRGAPIITRVPGSDFTLATFMRSLLFSVVAALRVGLDVLTVDEHVSVASMFAQGGVFATPGVMQKILADGLDIPITVGDDAGEGGPWGMALLASYASLQAAGGVEGLEDFLARRVFVHPNAKTIAPDPKDVQAFTSFLTRYKRGLPIVQSAVETLGTSPFQERTSRPLRMAHSLPPAA